MEQITRKIGVWVLEIVREQETGRVGEAEKKGGYYGFPYMDIFDEASISQIHMGVLDTWIPVSLFSAHPCFPPLLFVLHVEKGECGLK